MDTQIIDINIHAQIATTLDAKAKLCAELDIHKPHLKKEEQTSTKIMTVTPIMQINSSSHLLVVLIFHEIRNQFIVLIFSKLVLHATH